MLSWAAVPAAAALPTPVPLGLSASTTDAYARWQTLTYRAKVTRSGTLTHKAGYHLFTIGQDETGFLLTAELRGLRPDGTVGGMGMLSLARIRQPTEKS